MNAVTDHALRTSSVFYRYFPALVVSWEDIVVPQPTYVGTLCWDYERAPWDQVLGSESAHSTT
jgi:hypothetical protein